MKKVCDKKDLLNVKESSVRVHPSPESLCVNPHNNNNANDPDPAHGVCVPRVPPAGP